MPTITISGATNVDEGSPYSLTLGAISDPGADTVTSWIVHWGDGSSDTYTADGVVTHTYADGPDSHAITVDLTDEDGLHLDRANDLGITVDNVAPQNVDAGEDDTVDEGDAVRSERHLHRSRQRRYATPTCGRSAPTTARSSLTAPARPSASRRTTTASTP